MPRRVEVADGFEGIALQRTQPNYAWSIMHLNLLTVSLVLYVQAPK